MRRALLSHMAVLQDLIVWQLADELRQEVLRLAACPAVKRDFRLRDQLTSSAGSVPANVAEGYARQRHAEFARFLDYASGSLRETEEWLRDGEARGIWSPEDLAAARRLCRRLTPAILNLRRHLKNNPTPK